MSSEAALDLDFYRAHHDDLRGLNPRQARSHYERHGRPEGRPATAAALLETLQAQEAALPEDFETAEYLRLNPDLKITLPHPWQPAAHYITSGRKEGRRYRETAGPAAAAASPTILRASTQALRRRLGGAFGADRISEPLLNSVHAAQRKVQAAATIASPVLEPVLLARWLLRCAGSAAVDVSSLHVQLRILYDAAFGSVSGGVMAQEAEAMDRARSLAVGTSVLDAADGRPAVTLLMLAAEASYSDRPVQPPLPAEAMDLLARFFILHVPRRGLQGFVTREQRRELRMADAAGVPLAMALRDMALGRTPEPGGPTAQVERFWAEDVWSQGLDYILGSEDLEARQLAVVTEDGEPRMRVPAILERAGVGRDGLGESGSGDSWRRFVTSGREAQGLPQLILGPSVLAGVKGERLKPAPGPRRGVGPGRKRLRPGELATFCVGGSGERHLVGLGWHALEPERVWTSARTALIAVDLEDDAGALDIILQVSTRQGPSALSLYWNGRLVGAGWSTLDREIRLHAHLGRSHNSLGAANILCLSVDSIGRSVGDGRMLGVALHSMMLVRR